jgi:CBS domain-containing protein/gamma-glutamyl:cysteine ligase YbdK (ATP-grasp superfamily)
VGAQDVLDQAEEGRMRAFQEALLRDLQALELMLSSNLFETDVVRVGAEQEMFLVNRTHSPAQVAPQVLDRLHDPAFTTEMGKFNLEANLEPRRFEGTCLRAMEDDLTRLVRQASTAAQACGAEVLLTGILPSVRPSDLVIANLTDRVRYHELNRTVMKMRGGAYHVYIKGVDELKSVHDSVMLETCCGSFQVHLQMDPGRFAAQYNAAQLGAAPLLAAAVNAPLLLGKRLWSETRIALFQHAVDERSHTDIARNHPSRVAFGDRWVDKSVLEIYREQILRFRSIMSREIVEDPVDLLAQGKIPKLSALALHNGTVWRWNRPCYGVTEGRPHLRLEFRAFPAGPTIVDEVANASFFLGLGSALPEEYGDIAAKMPFEEVKDNFFAAARHGLKAQVAWVDGKNHPVSELIVDELLPLASQGLKKAGVDAGDIDRYLGVIRDRVISGQTGSKWTTAAASFLTEHTTAERRDRRIVEAMLARQNLGEPVDRWPCLSTPEREKRDGLPQTAAEVMATDLFTVRPNDPVTLAASMMDWRHIRNVPVEDESGRLVGLVSSRDLLRLISKGGWGHSNAVPIPVRVIMQPDPVSVAPETSLRDALKLMMEHAVDCLPVTTEKQLLGLVTSFDLLTVLASLFEADQKADAGASG